MNPTKLNLTALAASITLCTIFTSTIHAAPDAARVAGDLKVDGIHFSVDGSVQTKASPWGNGDPKALGNIGYMQGNVGIGTLTPTAMLDVAGSINASGTISATNASGNGIFGFSNSTTGIVGMSSTNFIPYMLTKAGVFGLSDIGTGVYGSSSSGNGVIGVSNSGDGVFGSSIAGYAGNFQGNVNITGNVGLGTLTPTAKLDVAGTINASGTISATNASGNGIFGFSNSTTGIVGMSSSSFIPYLITKAGVYGLSDIGTGVYGSSSSGIGAMGSSTTYLGVYGLSTNSAGIKGESTNNTGVWGVGAGVGVDAYSTNGYGVKGTTGDNIAVYGVNSSVALPAVEGWNQGSGDILRAWSGASGSQSLKFRVLNNGNATFVGVVTASNISAPSDIRLKTDIQPLENTLDKVLKLRGVSYVMKADETKSRMIGVIAQELELEYPEMVLTDEKGMKSVAYANLTPVLIEAVKTLKIENDNLKADNAVMKGHLERIEKQLIGLEVYVGKSQ